MPCLQGTIDSDSLGDDSMPSGDLDSDSLGEDAMPSGDDQVEIPSPGSAAAAPPAGDLGQGPRSCHLPGV